jgi:hypothetical protein
VTNHAGYTDAEWDLLTRLPTFAVFGAMAAEDGGPVTSTREIWAGMEELAQSARAAYAGNALIQAVRQAIVQREDGSELPLQDWRSVESGVLPEAIVESALETAANARQVLADRATPEEAAGFLAWVMDIAKASVHAAKSGFLGLSGAEVTPRESQFLSDLAAALGVEA